MRHVNSTMLGDSHDITTHHEQDVADCVSSTSTKRRRYVHVIIQYLPLLTGLGATLPQETKDKLFITSLENIEYSILLETEARTMKWGWLFRTYVQWHAIAFLLSELCVRTKGEAVERAWRALEATAGRWWFPLNDSSPYRKGQQGCLWKPLRKLLAKARAARERELALERASMALRTGQYSFNYPQGLDQLNLPPVSADQPSPENLDRLLRPSAPKLGEMPTASLSSWHNSPSSPSLQGPFSNSMSNSSRPEQSAGGSISQSQGSSNEHSPGQDFHNLSTYGLDNVIIDVMEDMTYEGTSSNDYSRMHPSLTTNGVHSTTATMQPLTNTAPQPFSSASAPSMPVHPTFGDNTFSNPSMNFLTTSPTLDNNGVQTESPNLDSGNMDWTLWDDMVNQYGIEGQTVNPANSAANGPGHLGLVHWF